MLKNSLIALQGTVIAQGIGFLFVPILTRIYSPADFGTYQLYFSIVSLLIVAASLRYEYALLRAQRGLEEGAVLHLCLILTLLLALVAGISFGLFATKLPQFEQLPEHSILIILLSLVFGGIYQFLSFVFLRVQRLQTIALAKICRSLHSRWVPLCSFLSHCHPMD